MMAIASFAMGVWASSPFTNADNLLTALNNCVAGDASGATCTDGNGVNIADWDISGVTSLLKMFHSSAYISFNADISGWDTSNVVDMSAAFDGAQAFNQNIGSWDTQQVTDMKFMFNNAQAFNQDIGGWNTEGVTDMRSMFRNAQAFNQDIRISVVGIQGA